MSCNEVLQKYYCTLHYGWIPQPNSNFVVLNPALAQSGCGVEQEILYSMIVHIPFVTAILGQI
jgi:hypothetical protein